MGTTVKILLAFLLATVLCPAQSHRRLLIGKLQGYVSPMPLLADAVSYWKFDETDTGPKYDSIGPYHATNLNTVYTNTAIAGVSAFFKGAGSPSWCVTSNLVCADVNKTWTLSGWIYNRMPTATAMLLGRTADASVETNQSYYLQIEGTNSISLYYWTNRTWAGWGLTKCTPTTPMVSNTWYLITLMHNTTNRQIVISVNCTNWTTNVMNSLCPNTATTWGLTFGTMGKVGHDFYEFHGQFDEWVYYERILASNEVSYIYNGGTGRTWPY